MLRDNIRSINLSLNSEGIVQCYDINRGKVLSVSRETFTFGINHRNIIGKRWLNLTGNVNSSMTGYKLPRDATITSMTVQTRNIVNNARFNLRKNSLISNIHTSSLVGVNEIIEDNLNYDVNQGDYLQLFLSVIGGNVDYPIVTVELAWK